jgi:AraC family transcriptional regulator of adaptative response/methylated-DNA-[protein]-cysteine methyltransferase
MKALTPRRPYATDDDRWSAVVRREASADAAFRYAVRTTGVYCRPSCAARRPRRENVSFFATAAEAERDGFRPCLRCRPNGASLAERQAAAVADACRRITGAEKTPGLEELSRAAGLSRFHFHRVFKAATGLTPRAYAAAGRADRLRVELARGGTVTGAMYRAGFNSSGRFYAAAGAALGMTPTAFRFGGAGATIRFAVNRCSLGSILVAAGAKGVCFISMGDDGQALARELRERFSRAELVNGEAEFDRLVAAVVACVEEPRLGLNLPLDVRGTAFQRRVWQALRDIPAGTTATYADVARKLGAPRAARAVAGACAANVLAVAIPCHRVVRTNGGLSGYRWGVGRKRALLDRELKP